MVGISLRSSLYRCTTYMCRRLVSEIGDEGVHVTLVLQSARSDVCLLSACIVYSEPAAGWVNVQSES